MFMKLETVVCADWVVVLASRGRKHKENKYHVSSQKHTL